MVGGSVVFSGRRKRDGGRRGNGSSDGRKSVCFGSRLWWCCDWLPLIACMGLGRRGSCGEIVGAGVGRNETRWCTPKIQAETPNLCDQTGRGNCKIPIIQDLFIHRRQRRCARYRPRSVFSGGGLFG